MRPSTSTEVVPTITAYLFHPEVMRIQLALVQTRRRASRVAKLVVRNFWQRPESIEFSWLTHPGSSAAGRMLLSPTLVAKT